MLPAMGLRLMLPAMSMNELAEGESGRIGIGLRQMDEGSRSLHPSSGDWTLIIALSWMRKKKRTVAR